MYMEKRKREKVLYCCFFLKLKHCYLHATFFFFLQLIHAVGDVKNAITTEPRGSYYDDRYPPPPDMSQLHISGSLHALSNSFFPYCPYTEGSKDACTCFHILYGSGVMCFILRAFRKFLYFSKIEGKQMKISKAKLNEM